MTTLLCECGDSTDMHIDGMEQCFNGDCGCREFTEVDLTTEEDRLADYRLKKSLLHKIIKWIT